MSAQVVGRITPAEPWGMSTQVQTLTAYLAQAASVALGDLDVAVWTAKTPDELNEVMDVLHELHAKVNQALSAGEALHQEFHRRGN